MQTVAIVRPQVEHRDAWERLYAAYAEFYRVEQTAEMRDTVLAWLLDDAHTSQGLVVFHIGMTIRKPHRPDLWAPVAAAMPRMLAELHRAKDAATAGRGTDLGFLGASTLLGARGPWVVQYWRSVEGLYAYAHDADQEHLPAWRAFNRASRRHPDAVGIWHETYAVRPGGVETVYVGGACVGLGAATGTVPVERRGRTARERLDGGDRLTPAS